MRSDGKGWPVGRVLSNYASHVSAVKMLRPDSLAKPGGRSDAPRQCFELVSEFNGYDDGLMRRALGQCDPLTDEDYNRYTDFRDDLGDWLKENPWEPEEEDIGEPVNMIPLPTIARAYGMERMTLWRWVAHYGMPHIKLGKLIFIQQSVMDKWQDMKVRHRLRRHNLRKIVDIDETKPESLAS
jgi:predicted DNA-binding transcriptional regulator AlpA